MREAPLRCRDCSFQAPRDEWKEIEHDEYVDLLCPKCGRRYRMLDDAPIKLEVWGREIPPSGPGDWSMIQDGADFAFPVDRFKAGL